MSGETTTGTTRRLRRLGFAVGGVLLPTLLWEAYKLLGPDRGVVLGGRTVLPRTTDLAMPHVWTMLARLVEPVSSVKGSPPLWRAVADAALFTLGIASIGWLLGVLIGVALALVMLRMRVAKSAMLPWIVLSQTVPLIAIAPLVRRWGAQLTLGPWDWQSWMSVSVISAYLAFFPVAVNALKGLESPKAAHLDLMRAYSIGWWRTLTHLRLPAAVPYLLSGLRLAAANAVVGAVVAEVSIGLRGGIGRLIVEYAAASGGDPGKPWGPIFGAVTLGLVAVGVVSAIGALLHRYRRGEVAS
ncbi:MAG: ABC transporter permease subunit [Kineosporiaceae bacterium]